MQTAKIGLRLMSMSRLLLIAMVMACGVDAPTDEPRESRCHPCDPNGNGSEARAAECLGLSELCAAAKPNSVYLDCVREGIAPPSTAFYVKDKGGRDVPCICLDD